MLNILKLILFEFITVVGLFTIFGVAWQQCGLILTSKAMALLVVLAGIVAVPYSLLMLRW